MRNGSSFKVKEIHPMLTAFKTMTKDDIQGFMLIPVIFTMCIYNKELAELIGIGLNYFFAVFG
jgi:hypothetical protein